jgi:hypothetical protein
MAILVASTAAPPLPFVPEAVTHVPALTAVSLTATVAVIRVLAVKITVVWPLSWLCTSSVFPVMLAIVPEAAGANDAASAGRAPPPAPPAPLPAPPALSPPAGELAWLAVATAAAAVVVVLEALAADGDPPPPHALNINDATASAPPAPANRRLPVRNTANLLTTAFPPGCN